MSKLYGIAGGLSGRTGSLVYAIRGGQTIQRVYQPIVSNPRTFLQREQRSKFTELSRAARVLGCIVRVGLLPAKRGGVSQRNRFIALNGSAVSGSEDAGYDVDYSSVIVSEGGLTNVTFGSADFQTPASISVPISDALLVACDADPNDDVYVGVYIPERGYSMLSMGRKRSAFADGGSITMTMPASAQGMRVHLWGFVQRKDENGVLNSPSVYIGSGMVS